MIIAFEIINPEGDVEHTGAFDQYDVRERRAFAERIAKCQANGFEIRTWRQGCRPGCGPEGEIA
ncbi:hypothetical protein KNU96_gp67 [Xanthomonas phage FoX5]|uniref:Uncharacterized protein n=2 Tax=Foxunavirus TaxID=2948712 RepID=A0A858NQR7_9CAUD|nr:hypothetical protein KNU95_gp42 [Xanthomonas phage FoX3]YP_010106910.1 hypothetical protein KNU96_gp67 [Xanthomonas phage FoX5]QJB21942.1 hypothetical protein XccvBFoX3_gp42 [Xanthomonas phage FoX3]QJB22023.1 hypothetical protein XccvBFoX5_gp45 [Xanthomonas phage FoX5]